MSIPGPSGATARWSALLLFLGGALASRAVANDASTVIHEVDGWKLEVRLIPEKRRPLVGEPIWVHFDVRNLGSEDLEGQHSYATSAIGRSLAFRIQIVRADTDEALVAPDPGPVVGSMLRDQPLPVEGTHRTSLFLPYWAVFDRPGRYLVTCERTLVLRPRGQASYAASRAVPTTTRVVVDVLPSDAEALGEVVRTHAKEILLGDDDATRHLALRSLSTIRDERTVAWWLEILDTGDSHRMYEAASALGAYASERAFAGLRRASRTQARDVRSGNPEDPAAGAGAVRSAAARSLGRCGHAEAFGVLLAMRADPRAGVRRRVAWALAEHGDAAATEALKQLATDSDPKVRRAAEDALGRRATPR